MRLYLPILFTALLFIAFAEIHDIHDNTKQPKFGVAQERVDPTCEKRSHKQNFTPPERTTGDYDFIVIGGGSAGAVVATRLAEVDPTIRVLILENGKNLIDDSEVMSDSMSRVFKTEYCVPGQTAETCSPLSLPLHFSETPFMTPYLSVSNHSYYYQTTPQLWANKRELNYPRGKLLGGSSATNNMIAFRGHPSDYDEWASLGLEGWGYEDLLPFMKRIETNHQFGADPAHGTDGPIHLHDSSSFFKFPLADALLEAAWEMGYPKVEDFNKGHDYYGAGYWQQYSNEKARRTSSYEYIRRLIKRNRVCIDGFIAHAMGHDVDASLKVPENNRNRKNKEKCTADQNLHILTDSLAIKLIIEKSPNSTSKPRVVGVEYVNSSHHSYDSQRKFKGEFGSEEEKSRKGQQYWKAGERPEVLNCPVDEKLAFDYDRESEWFIPPEKTIQESDIKRVYANREVILSAGAIATPQLMMLSGIGPAKHLLHQLNFTEQEIVMDLPGLGRVLDHEEVTVIFKTPHHQHWGIVKDMLPETAKWVEGKPSSFGSNHAPAGMDISSEGTNGTEPTIHIHFIMLYFEGLDMNMWRKQDAAHRVPVGMTDFAFYKGLQHYTALIERCGTCSEGRITLRNRDPLVMPFVDPNYGSCAFNNDEIIFGIKEVRKLNALLPKEFRGEEVFPGVEVDTDEKLLNWLRNFVWGHHISGSAPMGSCDDPQAVLDNHGRVYGVEGLRVADASAFPKIPHGNILYSTYIVGERIAEHILLDNELVEKERKSILNPTIPL